MKVLTLHQPWASLVALGVKTIETRSWSTAYRGPLAIHAAATMPSYDKRYVRGVSLVHDYEFAGGGWWITLHGEAVKACNVRPAIDSPPGRDYPAPLGAIVATCTLRDVVPVENLAVNDRWAESVPERFKGWLQYDTNPPIVVPGLLPSQRITVVDRDQRPYGDFTPGRFAWLLDDVKPVDPPVPFRGGQGLTKTWEPAA